jgi:predicted small secreted protein
MKSVLWITLAAATLLTSSCNTFIGMGRDFKLMGEGMENTANKANGGQSGGGSGAPVY